MARLMRSLRVEAATSQVRVPQSIRLPGSQGSEQVSKVYHNKHCSAFERPRVPGGDRGHDFDQTSADVRPRDPRALECTLESEGEMVVMSMGRSCLLLCMVMGALTVSEGFSLPCFTMARFSRAGVQDGVQRHAGARSGRACVGRLRMSGSPEDSYSDAAFMLAPVEGDEMVSMITDNGEVSVRAVTATGLVAGAAQMQATSPVASAALGRTMICSLMLAAGKKTGEMYGEVEQESVQIDVRGDGPLKQSFATADGRGEVRGYVAQPFVDLPPNSIGKLDVAAAVGKGIITVVRNNPLWKQPYSGITQIVSGEIAVDMAHYLTESEQTPSALGAGVLVDSKDENVIASGGWLVQMLPGATDETITQIEKNIGSLDGSPTDLIRSGKTANDICNLLSAGLREGEIYPPTIIKPRFTCKCSMEKVYRTIALLPREEMDSVLEQEGKIEVKCEFCKRKYRLAGAELEDAYKSAKSSEDS